MNNLKKIGSAVGLSLVVSMSVYASQPDSTKRERTPEQKAEIMTFKMKQSLNLTDDQASKVKVISTNAIKSVEDFRTKTENDVMEQYKKVLTPEQFASLQKKKAEREAKHKEGRGEGHEKGDKKNIKKY